MSFFRELNIKHLFIGLFIALLLTLFSLFLISVIMFYADIDSSMASPLSSIGLLIGCFFGALYTSKKHGKNGLLIGMTTSFILFIIITIASLSVSLDKFGILTLIHGLIMLLSGGIGGIIGVNKNKNFKI